MTMAAASGISVTACSTADARAWWRIEAVRTGTDWRGLIDAAEAVLSGLRIAHEVSS
jgi:hypothetical protein